MHGGHNHCRAGRSETVEPTTIFATCRGELRAFRASTGPVGGGHGDGARGICTLKRPTGRITFIKTRGYRSHWQSSMLQGKAAELHPGPQCHHGRSGPSPPRDIAIGAVEASSSKRDTCDHPFTTRLDQYRTAAVTVMASNSTGDGLLPPMVLLLLLPLSSSVK